jgi:hypothetical protein
MKYIRGVPFKNKLSAKWAYIFDQLGLKWEYDNWNMNGYKPNFIINNEIYVSVSEKNIWDYYTYIDLHRSYIKSKCPKRMAVIGNGYYQKGNKTIIGKMFYPNGIIEDFIIECAYFSDIWNASEKEDSIIKVIYVFVIYVIFLLIMLNMLL